VQLLAGATEMSRAKTGTVRYVPATRDCNPRGARSRPLGVPQDRELSAEYSERWFDERKRRGLSSIDTDRGRMRNHVFPLLSTRPIREVTQDELREVVESLDSKVLDGVFSWRTAQKVWGLVTKLFSDACQSKAAVLRVRDNNPAMGVRGPDSGVVKAKQWLFPAESTLLLRAGDSDVRPRWRRLYALSIYLYTRPGELAVLRWDDVNLEQQYVSIHRALDLKTGLIKPTKTGVTRRVPIHARLASVVWTPCGARTRLGRPCVAPGAA
jgi:integrase